MEKYDMRWSGVGLFREKKVVIFLISIVFIIGLSSNGLGNDATAQDDSWTDANRIAEIFAGAKESQVLGSEDLISKSGQPLARMFDLYPQGYIIVPFSRDLPPVIAWSTEADRTPERSVLEEILELDITERLVIHEKTPNPANRTRWIEILSETEADSVTQWGPWLYTNWGQGEPYNRFCPIDPETDEKCPSGCTIVVATMIMNYWEYPHRIDLTADDSYWSNYTDPPIWIDGPEWDMDTMIWIADGYSRPSWDMVARLMRAVGVNVEAHYSSSGTGAFCSAHNFLDQWEYSTASDMREYWNGEVLRRNLRQGKPMWVSMYGLRVGHAIVADGLLSTGELHFNMGWNGTENGWYNVLDDHFPTGYTVLGSFIHDITAPLPPDFTEPVHLSFSGLNQKISNAFHYLTDIDVFTFNATSDSSYIFFTNGPHHTFFEIYDSSFTVLLHRIDGGDIEGYGNNAFVNFRPPEGTSGFYHLVVGSYSREPDVIYSLFYCRTSAVPWPFVEMLYPVSGTHVSTGEEHTLYYYCGGAPAIRYVTLEYSTVSADGPYRTIADSLTAGHLAWTVPETYSVSDTIFIRARSADGIRISEPNLLIIGPDAISEAIPARHSLSAYPNPFNSALQIATAPGASITIFNTLGRAVYEANSTGSLTWTPDEQIPSGLYIIQSTTADGVEEVGRALLVR